MIITKLSVQLKKELKTADEIWIAVALLNSSGLKQIVENLNNKCKQNYIIGIDLPTEPNALSELYKSHLKSGFQVKIYSEKQYFHPKLYLIRKQQSFTAYIGSANCTNGGLHSNVELSIKIEDQETCNQILTWFNSVNQIAKPLTKQFIDKYKNDYLLRLRKKKEDEKLVEKQKDELNDEVEATFIERKEFLKVLKKYRASKNHIDVFQERKQSIKKLRKLLDYPNFNSDKIDVDGFFKIPALGNIIAIPKPTIKREIKKFSKLLQMICDDSIDISERYNRALSGDLEIRGVKKGLISKVLAIHNSEKYFVENNKTLNALKRYGIEFPRGLTKGDKYKITCRVLQEICKETNIENLAVLDYYLYLEGEE